MTLKKLASYAGAALGIAIGVGLLPSTAIAQTASPEAPAVSPATSPASEVSETKRLLIYELLEITGGRQQHEQTQQIMFAQVQQQMQAMVGQLLGGAEGGDQPSADELTASFSAFMTQFSEALQAEITYEDYLERVYYPVYDQYLTEADLRGLIAFYETPLGEKLVSVQPQLLEASMARAGEMFTPQIIEIANRLLEQQFSPPSDESAAP
ncbi:MAG: DUF2059 domain-containing protein [Elainellaceae cyanobacterium]